MDGLDNDRIAELEALLLKAYEVAPKKREFIVKMETLPGTITSNISREFCHGFLDCLKKTTNDHDTTIVVSAPHSPGFTRSFVLENTDAFTSECNRVINKEYRVNPTPEKVMVKMVFLRLNRLRKEINTYNDWCKNYGGRSAHQIIKYPTIRSNADLVAYQSKISTINTYSIHRVQAVVSELIARIEITDTAYNEAWNLFEVQGVMET